MTTIIASMFYGLMPGILAARRNEDENGWIQLLVFAVMAVFFVISNIIKAARSRKQQQEQEELEEAPMVKIPPLRRRPIPRPEGPAGGKKIFSHKIPQAVPEAVPAQPVEEVMSTKFAAAPEEAKHEIEIPSVELIALEKRDELARGIIYSEILGKPLALRDSWGYE